MPLCKAMVCGFGDAVCGLSVNASLDGASEASPLQLAAWPRPPNYLVPARSVRSMPGVMHGGVRTSSSSNPRLPAKWFAGYCNHDEARQLR